MVRMKSENNTLSAKKTSVEEFERLYVKNSGRFVVKITGVILVKNIQDEKTGIFQGFFRNSLEILPGISSGTTPEISSRVLPMILLIFSTNFSRKIIAWIPTEIRPGVPFRTIPAASSHFSRDSDRNSYVNSYKDLFLNYFTEPCSNSSRDSLRIFTGIPVGISPVYHP